jgi:glutaredoxin 3
MAPVKIYTTNTCSYCHAALDLLRRKGVAFEQVDVTGDFATRRWLAEATGRSTVPQIFIGERSYGGYTDIRSLERDGTLDAILAGA